jgi:TonB-linked SusC/RagA family outer membrane protein
MMKTLLLFSALLMLTMTVKAQTRTITGTVVSKSDNGPLVGVTISIKGSNTATATDVDGKFSIKATSMQNVVLGVKYLGYEYQEITLKPGEMKVDFSLVATNSNLNEVVVTGYGTTLKGKLLGNVSEIKGEDIQDIPVANLGTALADRLTGVGVSVASGKPGSTTTLTVGGPITFGGGGGITSDPLYVIDGLISQKSDFDNLDASLVETISFLKDSQAAIYGAAGDKGVVLVTTKRGKPGKPQISYSGYFGTSTYTEDTKMMSGLQMAQFINDDAALNNLALTSRFSTADLNYIATHPQKTWFDQLWHSSNTERHTLSLSGGTDKVTFFAGGSYYNQGGNFGDISITKWNIRSGMTARLSDDITAYVSLNANYDASYDNGQKSESTDTENYVVKSLVLTPPWIPLYINGLPVGVTTNGPGFWNPVSEFNSGSYSTSAAQALNLNTSIEWRPHFVKGLTAKVQYGKTDYSTNGKNWYAPYNTNTFVASGQNGLLYGTTSTPKLTSNGDQIFSSYGYNNNYELIGSLDYSRTINKHTFDVLVVSEQTEANADNTQEYRTGPAQIPNVDQFFAYSPSTTTLQTLTPSETGKLSYLVRANYDYAGKYLMEFIGREDGSSNFPPDKRWGFFPSVAVGWRVSEENFFKNSFLSKFINTLKVRFNEGLVGDDRVTPYQYLSHFTPYGGTALFGNAVQNGLTNGILPNTDITWEHSRTQDLGIDATFLDNRLTVTIDSHAKYVYDGFVDISTLGYPATLGLNSGIINYDAASSWGTDFSLSWSDNIGKNWRYNISLTNLPLPFINGNSETLNQYYNPLVLGQLDQNQTITTGLLNTTTSLPYGFIATGIIRTQAQLDAILKANPNYTIEGVKPQLGFMNFEDVNHDGKINADDQTQMFTHAQATPWLNTGFTFSGSYKQVSLSVNGHLTLGGKVFIGGQDVKAPTVTTSGAANGPVFWADHWTPQNPNAEYPRADAPDVSSKSTFWARNGSTGYINNATMSYTLPKAIADRLKIPSLRLILNATNPWEFIDPYDYKDSRTGDITSYPVIRTISIGVNATL